MDCENNLYQNEMKCPLINSLLFNYNDVPDLYIFIRTFFTKFKEAAGGACTVIMPYDQL